MKYLELRVPPLLLLLVFGVVAFLFAAPFVQGSQMEVFSDSALLSVAVICLILGAYIALSGVFEFRKYKTTVDPIHPQTTSQIVTSGIYQKTRNPMYVGFVLILAGWCLALGVVQTLWVLPLFVLYLTKFQIEPEEKVLEALFGEDFKEYCLQTPRWWGI